MTAARALGRTITLSPEQQMLKSATRAAVKAFGGQLAVAAACGRRQQHYSDVGLPNTPDFITLDDIALIEANTHGTAGHPHVTRALCRNAGGVFVALPAAQREATDLLAAFGEMAKEFAGVAGAVVGVVADGVPTHAQWHEIAEQMNDLLARAVELDVLLDQQTF